VSLEEFIQNWGYVAVFLGALIEGESIILPAGAFAHQGYLSLGWVMLVAFTGTLLADQGLYYLGRHYGSHFLDKYPSWRERADRAFKLLHRFESAYILSFRFIYGIRIISPVIIGVSGVSPKRFTILNIIAAAIWSVLSCSAGYFLADVITHEHNLPKYILGGVIVIGLSILGYRKWKNRTVSAS